MAIKCPKCGGDVLLIEREIMERWFKLEDKGIIGDKIHEDPQEDRGVERFAECSDCSDTWKFNEQTREVMFDIPIIDGDYS